MDTEAVFGRFCLQTSTEQLRSFSHAAQSEPSTRYRRRALLSFIFHSWLRGAVAIAQLEVDGGCVGVLAHVGQRLLRHAIEG